MRMFRPAVEAHKQAFRLNPPKSLKCAAVSESGQGARFPRCQDFRARLKTDHVTWYTTKS